MKVDDNTARTLQTIANHWNQVECRIKRAENLSRYAVIPSINELRYAGRQLIDTIDIYNKNPDNPDLEEIEKKFYVISQYLNNADHDATDSIIDDIWWDTREASRQFGKDNVKKQFPDFVFLERKLQEFDQKREEARGNRQKRAETYEAIRAELENEGGVISVYREFLAHWDQFFYQAAVNERALRLSNLFNWITGVASVLSFLLALVLIIWPRDQLVNMIFGG